MMRGLIIYLILINNLRQSLNKRQRCIGIISTRKLYNQSQAI